MPHSPRIFDGRLWLLESGTGQLLVMDPATGNRKIVMDELPCTKDANRQWYPIVFWMP